MSGIWGRIAVGGGCWGRGEVRGGEVDSEEAVAVCMLEAWSWTDGAAT